MNWMGQEGKRWLVRMGWTVSWQEDSWWTGWGQGNRGWLVQMGWAGWRQGVQSWLYLHSWWSYYEWTVLEHLFRCILALCSIYTISPSNRYTGGLRFSILARIRKSRVCRSRPELGRNKGLLSWFVRLVILLQAVCQDNINPLSQTDLNDTLIISLCTCCPSHFYCSLQGDTMACHPLLR